MPPRVASRLTGHVIRSRILSRPLARFTVASFKREQAKNSTGHLHKALSQRQTIELLFETFKPARPVAIVRHETQQVIRSAITPSDLQVRANGEDA